MDEVPEPGKDPVAEVRNQGLQVIQFLSIDRPAECHLAGHDMQRAPNPRHVVVGSEPIELRTVEEGIEDPDVESM